MDEAMRSFPSGHSSFSFASLLFLSIYMNRTMKIHSGFAVIPTVIAAAIAISRVYDRWHHGIEHCFESIGCSLIFTFDLL